MIQTLNDLIAGFGGAEATARALSARAKRPIGAKAVYKWVQRGALPGKWVAPAYEEAQSQNLPVTVETLFRLAHPETGNGHDTSEAA